MARLQLQSTPHHLVPHAPRQAGLQEPAREERFPRLAARPSATSAVLVADRGRPGALLARATGPSAWSRCCSFSFTAPVFAFLINAVHELGHGTVFKTKALNAFFVRVFAFSGWINFEMFNAEPCAASPLYAARARRPGGRAARSRSSSRQLLHRGIINPKGSADRRRARLTGRPRAISRASGN